MIAIEKYSAEKKNLWNEFLKNSKNGIFMLNRDFLEYHSDRFVDNSLMFYSEGTLIALLPLSKHDDEVISHGGLTFGGFIFNETMKQAQMNDCFNALIKYLRENNFKKLIYKKIPHIYTKFPSEEDLYSLWINNAKLLKKEPSTTIFLEKPFSLTKGRKSQISKAKRENIKVEESNNFEEFIALENSVLKTYHNTVAVHTADELKLLKNRFPDCVKLFIAKKDNEILAGSLLFEYPNLVHTQYLANSDIGRKLGALDLVIATLIEKYKDLKTYFDFGISTENNGLYLNEGLIFQKESFGGRTVVYETYELDL